MAKVKSTIYPGLRIAGFGIRFVDGEADVTDKEALDYLKGLGEEHGIVVGAAEVKKVEKAEKAAEKAGAKSADDGAGGPDPKVNTDGSETPGAGGAVTADPDGPAVAADGTERPAGNASTEVWAEFAKAAGVVFAEDATRKQIVEAVEAAGK
jgi:hypothetical protein